MKNKYKKIFAGLAAGSLAIALIIRHHNRQAEQFVWQKQRCPALDVLACPDCHGELDMITLSEGEGYHCPACHKEFPVVQGITYFIKPTELTGFNKRFAGIYDWMSLFYRAFSFLAFAYIGMNEEEGRREITDRLEPKGGRVLEVSIGPGVNLPYLVHRSDVGEIYGLDISLGQLKRCRSYVAHQGWATQLQLGNAESLPYLDNTFDGVFHVGGINFFNDKQKAIHEMIRVAKPGSRILICDETERGVKAYEKFFPGFMQSRGKYREQVVAPVALVPPEMQELRVFTPWKGWMYCIEFKKPLSQEVL